MRVLAVIPARGGSKGLPRKNIRLLAGLPLIGHSLRCARMCAELTRTIVSTDDAEIASISRELGGDVPFMRPEDLSTDTTPMFPVLQHAVRTVEAAEGTAYDAVALFDPTSPGRLPEDVGRAIAILRDDVSADGVVACSRPTFNPFWVGVVEREGFMRRALDTNTQYVRRQDVPPFYRINGALYVWRREFMNTNLWPDGNHRILEIPERRAFSIDDEYEFKLAELVITCGLVELPWLGRNSQGASA